jgi:hypothetical protein
MQIFNTAELKKGMILAEPVRNAQGQLLVNTGSRLSEKDIYKFKTWGVKKVAVRGKSKAAKKCDLVLEFETRESIEAELKDKFAEVLDDPVMSDIMDAAKRQLLQKHQNPENGNECA